MLGKPGSVKAAESLAGMARDKIIMDFDNFARWLNKEADAEETAGLLPAVFRHLSEDSGLANLLEANPYSCFDKAACRSIYADLACFSLSPHEIQDRAMRASIKQAAAPNLKASFWNDELPAPTRELVEAYGLYKLAALYSITRFDDNFNLTARVSIAQNTV